MVPFEVKGWGGGGSDDPEGCCQLQCHSSPHLRAKLCEVFLIGPELLEHHSWGDQRQTQQKITTLKVTPVCIFVSSVSGLCILQGIAVQREQRWTKESPRPEFSSCSDWQHHLGQVTLPSIGLSFLTGKWGYFIPPQFMQQTLAESLL